MVLVGVIYVEMGVLIGEIESVLRQYWLERFGYKGRGDSVS